MSKIIVTVIIPSKGNKTVLNQFFNEPAAFQDETVEQFYETKVLPKIDKAAGAGLLHKAAIVLRGGETTRTQTRGAFALSRLVISRVHLCGAPAARRHPSLRHWSVHGWLTCAGGPEIECSDVTDLLDDYVGMELSRIVLYVDQIGVQMALEPEPPTAQLQRQAMYEVSNYGRWLSVVGKGHAQRSGTCMLFVGTFGRHAEHVSSVSSPPHRS